MADARATCRPEPPVAHLALVVAAVRGGTTTTAGAGRSRHRSEVAFFVSTLIFLHTASSGACPLSPADPGPHEELQMNGMSFAARSAFRFSAAVSPLATLAALPISGIASAQDAVEWRTADGGNGHWYQSIPTLGLRWSEARDLCGSVGGHLVTLSSAAEDAFARTLTPDVTNTGFWIGASREPTSSCSASNGWTWVDGSPWNYTAWAGNQPDCWSSGQMYLVVVRGSYFPGWHDFDDTTSIAHAVVEWSADCNQDGIVDYGQIHAGELVDANANNIPDCCEQAVSCTPCQADVDESGVVNSVDLAAVLANWGIDGGKYPRADVNGDGTVNSADLASVLSEWGPCE